MLALKENKITFAYHLLNKAFGDHKPKILALAGLGFVGGLLEGIGVNAIIPLFSFVTQDAPTELDFISRAIARLFSLLHIEFALIPLLFFIAILFIGKACVSFIAHYFNAKISFTYEYLLRQRLFKDTLATTWPYLLQQKVGYVEKVLMDHVSNAAGALMLFSSSILLITNLVIYIFVAVNISLSITLLTLTTGGILFLVFKPLLYRTRIVSYQLSRIGQEVAHLINEHVMGMKIVKAMAVEEGVARKGNSFFAQLRDARLRLSLYQSAVNDFVQPISVLFILVIFAAWHRQPGFNFASFAVILYLIQKIFSYVQSIQGKLNSMSEYAPYLKSVIATDAQIRAHTEPPQGARSFSFQRALVFHDISFAYDAKKGNVLDRVSFTVQRGAMIGIIGPSGGGKTTIVDLLLRLFHPNAGTITIDGANINGIHPATWRKNVGYVAQDIFLLNDTIAHNISFYDHEITRERVMEAAKMANIHAFVTSLPEGYDTIVGERGVMLSAGQRQRIILARALVQQPQILILDEATSALDNESEAEIQKAIGNLAGRVSIIVIAHRLSTLSHCDLIVVLEGGTIVEQGSPDDLLKNPASYYTKITTLGESPT